MKKIALVVALLAIFTITKAQSNYKRSLGIRLSTHQEYAAIAASYKFFVMEPGAVELNLGFGNKKYMGENAPGVSLAGTFQYHFDIPDVKGLKWFLGAGLVAFNTRSDYNDYDGAGLGLYPTGGVDYKFANIPLNLSADFRPTFHIAGPKNYDNTYPHDVGIAARIAF